MDIQVLYLGRLFTPHPYDLFRAWLNVRDAVGERLDYTIVDLMSAGF